MICKLHILAYIIAKTLNLPYHQAIYLVLNGPLKVGIWPPYLPRYSLNQVQHFQGSATSMWTYILLMWIKQEISGTAMNFEPHNLLTLHVNLVKKKREFFFGRG